MLTVDREQFLLDGRPFQILSGAIHYFRVVPEHWRDRLLKLKECGLNTVETYLPWNLHEPKKGKFNFSYLADVEAFIELAQELGLYVILRPSPYICAEWEFGGLPAWLLADKNIELRCSNERFLQHVSDYYDELIPRLEKYQYEKGGPVLAFQIENEYGAYGNDKQYLTFLKNALVNRGITSLLFTSDGPEMVEAGSLPDVLTTVNFGSRPLEGFAKVEELKANHPKMCMEFWIGWFDHWGGEHHTRSSADVAESLKVMLENGASINFYMFHGGTNFGYMNGANYYEEYTPTVTSYDYDALLTESGEITEKYLLVQKIISEFKQLPSEVRKEQPKSKRYGKLEVQEVCSLFDALPIISDKKTCPHPLSMEQLGQNYGLTLYRTIVPYRGNFEMDITPIRDRAFVYINGVLEKIIYRNDGVKNIQLTGTLEENIIEILVENMGRVNYGKNLKDSKGIIEPLWVNNQFQFGWDMYPIELADVCLNDIVPNDERYPKFFHGSLYADESYDTFVSMKGWKKGYVFVNGFNLGSYWEEGPQTTLYIPGPLLKNGENEILIVELEGNIDRIITFLEKADLG